MAVTEATGKEQFNKSACPADLPAYDLGFENRMKMPLSSVMTAAARHADVIILGDTNHDHSEVRGAPLSAENLRTMSEAGVRHLYLEATRSLQPLVDDLAGGKIEDPEFFERFQKVYEGAQGNEGGAWAIDVMEGIHNAEKFGIKVHFYDEKSPFKMDPSKTDTENDKAFLARFDDRKVAQLINETREDGQKAVVISGDKHGSRFKDFEEFVNAKTLKIHLYENPAYFQAHAREYETLRKYFPAMGEDKPNAIFFLHDKSVYTTCNTSQALAAELKASSIPGSFVPNTSAPQEPQSQRKPLL